MKINQFLLLLTLFISSCRVGPTYSPPKVSLPSEWKAEALSSPQTEETLECDIDYWWEIFNDADLNELQAQAIQNSPNLHSAYERIVEARALAKVSKADLYPQFNLNPNYSDYISLFQLQLPAIPPAYTSPLNSFLSQPFRAHQQLYMLPLNLNYEIDLWGKIRNQYRAALLTAEAQEQAYLALLLSLTSDLASSYYQLRAFDSQLEITEKVIQSTTQTFELIQSRVKNGIATALDINQSTIDVTNAQSAYYDILRQRTLAENQIALLAGLSSSEFSIPRRPLKAEPPRLPSNIPSTILLQRPDVDQAERNLAAENARVGVAYAAYYPSFSLTGALGFSSPDIGQFLKWISRYWLLGANSQQVIWDGGRLDNNLIASWSQFSQAGSAYQQQILIAIKEVENALTNIQQQENQYNQLVKLSDATQKSYLLYQNRYKNGISSSLDVSTTLVNALNSELNTASLLGLRYVSTIELIKAFGGSW